MLALWPHWIYMARRLVDGSDEPWGLLALATVLVLLARDRAELVGADAFRAGGERCARRRRRGGEPRAARSRSGGGRDARAGTLPRPRTAAPAGHAARRPAAARAARHSVTAVLPGISAPRVHGTRDSAAPCAGGRGRQRGRCGDRCTREPRCSSTRRARGSACCGSAATRPRCCRISLAPAARARRSNAVAAALLVLAANVARNAALFFPEAGLVRWPAWSHEAIGLAALALAVVPIVLITSRPSR